MCSKVRRGIIIASADLGVFLPFIQLKRVKMNSVSILKKLIKTYILNGVHVMNNKWESGGWHTSL